MSPICVLVTDRIYAKTRRHLEKTRSCLESGALLYLACVEGFAEPQDMSTVRDCVDGIMEGNTQSLAEKIRVLDATGGRPPAIVALNQSAILPAIAIQRALGRPTRTGLVESCNKAAMRRLLMKSGDRLAMDFCVATPGEPGSASNPFDADGYIVKPAFGMSSNDVRRFASWKEAKEYAESPCNAKQWVPSHVMEALSVRPERTDRRVIEPYIDGTEFSVDGWINEQGFFAIVHHKLYMVQRPFFGDGPTISPPALRASLPDAFSELRNSEATIRQFGRKVLDALGFTRGVFHMEARERCDAELFLIEVNARAPGGSLWKSAALRTGYDLELVDAVIQLGKPVPAPADQTHSHVLHYPFYAHKPGILSDWGDLKNAEAGRIENLTVDCVMKLGDPIAPEDLMEEPYLAFAVTFDETLAGLLEKCAMLLRLAPPSIH